MIRALGVGWLYSIVLASCVATPAPQQPRPALYPIGYTEEGIASWYGPGFHGKHTASGERYDMHQLTAAHKTLPFGSFVRVERLDDARSVVVRINDRGPFVSGRIIDLSYRAARALGIVSSGTATVRLTVERLPTPPQHEHTFWIQVGSFSNIHGAQALRQRLATRYPTVRVSSVSLGSKLWYRVQVGVFSSESMARKVAEQLRREVSALPFVVQDTPADF